MAPMPLTGTIGTSSSIKGDGEAVAHRRTLPEPVVTFNLPVIRRPAVPQLERAARKTKQAVKEDLITTEAVSGETQLSLEASHILLQSLRQSRLIHLNAMLPYLSTRHRANTKYHSAPLDHPFPGGLEPPTTPHSLIHLGRADIRIGPLIFPKTRFGEVRVERRLSEGAVVPPSATKAVLKKEQRELKEQRKAEKKQAKSQVGSRNASPGNTSKVADASAADAAKTSSAKPSATTSTQPPIDDAVVQAVSKAGQKDPKLQALLHKAANGKAAPEELRDLAKFISQVSERLEKEKKTTATQNRSVPSSAAPTSAAATASSEQGDPQAAPSRASLPHHQVSQPSHSPIITIEYKENPNARFILPLWRGCAVERISQSDLRSIKVTMLLPAIGSAAATRASHVENKPSKKATLSEAKEHTSTHKTSDIPKDAQLTAAAPKGAETHSVTYHISGNAEAPLPDGIWQCFGRIKGVKTIIDGKVLDSSDDETLQQFIVKLRNLERESFYLPKLQVSPDEEMKELSEHLYDKFVPRMHTVLARPIVKLKKGDGGDEDEVEIVRDTSKKRKLHDKKSAGEEKRTKRASLASNHDGQGDILEEGSVSADEVGNPSKPKRKRHVAKYNSDGTLKLCQACGTNSTPMWRRGPAGKSTLCNACGAKWKVGRLIVSNEGAITPAEEKNADVSMSLDVDKQGRAADGDVPSEKPSPMETGVATEQEAM